MTGYGQAVPGHGGEDTSGQDFWIAAPAEIGKLSSAWSTLRKGQTGRLQNSSLPYILLGVGSVLLSALLALAGAPWLGIAFFFLGSFSSLYMSSLFLRGHEVSYVGAAGCARYVHAAFSRSVTSTVLPFLSAKTLYIARASYYINGSRSSCSVEYRWVDSSGKPLLAFVAFEQTLTRKPSDNGLFNFGAAAERVWIDFTYPRYERSLVEKGEAVFPLRNGSLSIFPDRLLLRQSKRETAYAASDLAGFSLESGFLKLMLRTGKPVLILTSEIGDQAILLHFLHTALGLARQDV